MFGTDRRLIGSGSGHSWVHCYSPPPVRNVENPNGLSCTTLYGIRRLDSEVWRRVTGYTIDANYMVEPERLH